MLKSMQETLERGFDILNEVYFNGELPPIVITIQSSPRTNGHLTMRPEWSVQEDRLYELNISAEHLDRPIENIMATLMHELTHYHCLMNGISDTSQNGRYHNKRFKEEAEKRGLIITYSKYIGWSVTEPGEDLIKIIREHGIEKPIDINRDGTLKDFMDLLGGMLGTDGNGNGGIGDGKGLPIDKKKTSTRKYVCPCCGNSFRATKDINVLCLDCNEQFVKVEK